MNKEGVIVDWKDDKGYGFIRLNEARKKYFFHINDFSFVNGKPKLNKKVNFVVGQDKQGRECALDIMCANSICHKFARFVGLQLILTLAFISTLIYFTLIKRIGYEVLTVYGIMGLLTFRVYKGDKEAALRQRWRTSEATLHMFSLLCGWPGASFAQIFLRHKSKKVEFRFVFFITVLINCYALACYVYPPLWDFTLAKLQELRSK